jgi:hypothetical protein
MLWLKRQLFKLYTRRQLKARQTALLMRKADLTGLRRLDACSKRWTMS